MLLSPNETFDKIVEHLRTKYHLNVADFSSPLAIRRRDPYCDDVGFDCRTLSVFIKDRPNVSTLTFHAAKAILYTCNYDAEIADGFDHLDWELNVADEAGVLAEFLIEFRAAEYYVYSGKTVGELTDDEMSELVECFMSEVVQFVDIKL